MFIKKLKENWVVLLVVVFSLTPVLWFFGRGGQLINGVDTNFPLNPAVWFQRRFFVWDAVSNAGQDFSSAVAGTFFHLIQVIPYRMGFGLQAVEMISLVFWFLLITSGSFILAKHIFPKHKLAQAVFVTLYSFNIYLFNSWENVKVANLSLMASIPLSLSLMISMKERKISPFRAFSLSTLIGLIASGSGINPSYIVTLFIIVFIFVLIDTLIDSRRNILFSIGQFFIWSLGVILANFYWILPTTFYILRNIPATNSLTEIGFNNWIDSLSENTSIFNILRMQGAWDWYAVDDSTGQPLYIPYAYNFFHKVPFVAFSVIIPLMAFASVIWIDKTKVKYYFYFLLLLIMGIFLGVGTHPPTGVLFAFFLKYAPFFNLFRSPWYIFTPLVVLAYAGLLGLFFSNAFDVLRKLNQTILLKTFYLVSLVVIAGNLFYSYPLVTGKIFRPERNDRFYVTFPDYIFESAEWLSNRKEGRILGYPDDELRQFTWGYRGVGSVLELITDNENIISSFNASNPETSMMIRKLYRAIKKDQKEIAGSIARKLSVSLLFEKTDQISLAPPLPDSFKSGELSKFGKWNFYEFPDRSNRKIYTSTEFLFGYPFSKKSELILALGDAHLVNPQDSVVNSTTELVAQAGKIVDTRNSQVEDLNNFLSNSTETAKLFDERNLSFVEYSFEIPSDGNYNPLLEADDLEDFGIDISRQVALLVDGRTVIWNAEDMGDFIKFREVFFSKGKHTAKIDMRSANVVLEENFGESYLELENKGKDAISRDFSLEDFDYLDRYLFEVSYRHSYGENPMVTLRQRNAQHPLKTQVEKLPNYIDWSDISFYFDPVVTPSVLSLSLNAGGATDPKGTKVFYDNLRVSKVFTNRLFFIEENNTNVLDKPSVEYVKESPVEYTAKVSNIKGTHVLIFAENYSPYWNARIYDENGIETVYKPRHFTVDTYANAWVIDNPPESYKIKIYYQPQDLYRIGLAISAVTLLVGIALLIIRK